MSQTSQAVKFFPKAENLDEPISARSLLPDWYKQQPGYNHFDHPTIKRCIPVFDAMSSGYFLLSPSNITVDSTNHGGLVVTCDNDFDGTLISQHDVYQYNMYPIPKGFHNHVLRINPMWGVKTPAGYSSLFIHPLHNGHRNLNALAGLIDTDNFISDGHLSFFVRSDTTFKIKKGTPLVQVIPFKRNEWESQMMSVEETQTAISNQDNSGLVVDGEHQLGGYKKLFHEPKSFR